MGNFFNKQVERGSYVLLLISLAAGWWVVKVLILLAPVLRKRNPKKDFLFFPYTHKDNTGTTSRFQQYFPFLDRDGYTYDIHYPSTKAQFDALYHHQQSSRAGEYNYYRKLFWQRLRWILKASRYKSVYFQRALFPEYIDQKRALLEQLLRVYNNNITVDYFDADFARNELFYNNIIKYCDKISVVNQFLFDYYIQRHPHVYINDLSIDTSRYNVKTDYNIHQPVRLFWTGLIENAEMNLSVVLPALEALNKSFPVILVMVSNSRRGFYQTFIEYHPWDLLTFYDLLAGSDIALYPVSTDDVYSRGKIAYKTLEYAAAGVPMIASPQGLSSRFTMDDVWFVSNENEWQNAVVTLLDDGAMRQRLAKSAHQKLLAYHDVSKSYKHLIDILLA